MNQSPCSPPKVNNIPPWAEGNYPGEMAKKACIKRAQKTWPKTDRHEHLQEAVKFMHDSEGSTWAEPEHRFAPGEKEQVIGQMREALIRGDGMAVAQIVSEYMPDKSITEMTEEEQQESMKMWSLFTSFERERIARLTNDTVVANDRVAMDRPDFNEPIAEQ